MTTTQPTARAKKAVAGTAIPVIFGQVTDPDRKGLVADLRRPGGNVTGVKSGDAVGKALEWMATLSPEAKTVYVPLTPQDGFVRSSLESLRKAAQTLEIELVLAPIDTPEELLAAAEALPENITGAFIPTSPRLSAAQAAFARTATERGLSVGAYAFVFEEALYAYTIDRARVGRQMARLADQVFRGANPADLPVKTAVKRVF